MASSSVTPIGRLDVSAWLLLEKKSTFSAAKWRGALASFSRARIFPPPARPQVLLALAFHEENAPSSAELVVVRPHVSPADWRHVDGHTRLPLEVRTMEDVRTAQRFLTSAPSQILDLFVDAGDVDRVLAFLVDPHARVDANTSPSEMIDGAFTALERAQQERERGKKARALALFREAERGFSAAERRLPDERARGLICRRRQDLERSIAALEAQMLREEAAASAGAGPATTPTPTPSGTETPKQPPQPSVDILARLEELRRFVASSDANAATASSSSKRHEEDTPPPPPAAAAAAPPPVASELATRLASLRNGGKVPASADVGELAERLRRLRGANSEWKVDASAWVKQEEEQEEVDEEGEVQRVIQQATEELALGIVDDLDADEEEDLSISSSVDSSSSSDGSDKGGRKK